MQEAYVRAYQHLEQYAGEAKFSTWLTKIAMNEALGRMRRRWRTESFESSVETNLNPIDSVRTNMRDPERQTYDQELRVVLEGAIGALPETYRSVFVLRAVEGLSSSETAACLDIGEEAVKSRLHRARKMLQKDLRERANLLTAQAFPFHLSRCDRVVNAVLKRIAPSVGSEEQP
jgi:RNA polymerase sigma-70 factor (ECF subfamily)